MHIVALQTPFIKISKSKNKNFDACISLFKDKMMAGEINYYCPIFHPKSIKLWLKSLIDLMVFTMTKLNDDQRKRMGYTGNYRIKNTDNSYVNIVQNITPMRFNSKKKPIIGLTHYTVLDGNLKMDICTTSKYLNDKNEQETLF